MLVLFVYSFVRSHVRWMDAVVLGGVVVMMVMVMVMCGGVWWQ